MVSAAILLPLCIAVPIVPDADLAIGLLAALIFVAHFWTSSATASIQTITPPHLRGQMTSIYIKAVADRSEEHTSELQSLMRISYAVFCLKKKTQTRIINHTRNNR